MTVEQCQLRGSEAPLDIPLKQGHGQSCFSQDDLAEIFSAYRACKVQLEECQKQ